MNADEWLYNYLPLSRTLRALPKSTGAEFILCWEASRRNQSFSECDSPFIIAGASSIQGLPIWTSLACKCVTNWLIEQHEQAWKSTSNGGEVDYGTPPCVTRLLQCLRAHSYFRSSIGPVVAPWLVVLYVNVGSDTGTQDKLRATTWDVLRSAQTLRNEAPSLKLVPVEASQAARHYWSDNSTPSSVEERLRQELEDTIATIGSDLVRRLTLSSSIYVFVNRSNERTRLPLQRNSGAFSENDCAIGPRFEPLIETIQSVPIHNTAERGRILGDQELSLHRVCYSGPGFEITDAPARSIELEGWDSPNPQDTPRHNRWLLRRAAVLGQCYFLPDVQSSLSEYQIDDVLCWQPLGEASAGMCVPICDPDEGECYGVLTIEGAISNVSPLFLTYIQRRCNRLAREIDHHRLAHARRFTDTQRHRLLSSEMNLDDDAFREVLEESCISLSRTYQCRAMFFEITDDDGHARMMSPLDIPAEWRNRVGQLVSVAASLGNPSVYSGFHVGRLRCSESQGERSNGVWNEVSSWEYFGFRNTGAETNVERFQQYGAFLAGENRHMLLLPMYFERGRTRTSTQNSRSCIGVIVLDALYEWIDQKSPLRLRRSLAVLGEIYDLLALCQECRYQVIGVLFRTLTHDLSSDLLCGVKDIVFGNRLIVASTNNHNAHAAELRARKYIDGATTYLACLLDAYASKERTVATRLTPTRLQLEKVASAAIAVVEGSKAFRAIEWDHYKGVPAGCEALFLAVRNWYRNAQKADYLQFGSGKHCSTRSIRVGQDPSAIVIENRIEGARALDQLVQELTHFPSGRASEGRGIAHRLIQRRYINAIIEYSDAEEIMANRVFSVRVYFREALS